MQPYTSNHVPGKTRVAYLIMSSLLFGYGTYGIVTDDIFIPGRRSDGAHYHGAPAWLVYGAIIAASLNLLSVIVDHYDKRNNETNYRIFAKVMFWLGWALYFAAFVLDLTIFKVAS